VACKALELRSHGKGLHGNFLPHAAIKYKSSYSFFQ
jgi:hypothetical protein